MAQDPLHVLWVEPNFPGRLGAVADWLVRRRGYRSSFYCHTADARASWPASVGKGLDVQVFGVGGVARESAVTWSRALERSLCYAYGCWEVLEKKRPRPIDLIVGRSTGLGSALFAPVYWPAAPVVNFLDYYYHAHRHDLADEAGPETAPAYFHWRRSMAAIELLDLEQASLGWTPTRWQRDLFPAEYRDEFLVLHDGVDTRRFVRSSWHADRHRPAVHRRPGHFGRNAGRQLRGPIARPPARVRPVPGCRQRLASRLEPMFCVSSSATRSSGAVWTSTFITAITPLTCWPSSPSSDADRLWFLGPSSPAVVAEVLAASDLHIAPSRPYPVARSLLEAMAAGCVVLASDTDPHREVIVPGQTGLLVDGRDTDGLARQALAVLADRAAYRPLGDAASVMVRERYAQDVCLPRLAERFSCPGCRQGGTAVNVLFIHDAFPAQFGRLGLELTGATAGGAASWCRVFRAARPRRARCSRRSSCTRCPWRPSIARATAFPGPRFTDTISSNAGRYTTRCAPGRACAPT